MVTATISTMNAIAEPTKHDLERLMPKPASAAISKTEAPSSASRATPCNVIIIS